MIFSPRHNHPADTGLYPHHENHSPSSAPVSVWHRQSSLGRANEAAGENFRLPHKLDSDSALRGNHGKSRQKTITLRVEIVNTSPVELPASELSGDALIMRAREIKERLVKESLGAVKAPAIKPNQKLTLDPGKIELNEIEFRNRKFEKTLEEWQVTCSQGNTETGKAVSSERYATSLKELEPAGGGKPRKKGWALAN